MKFIKLTQGKQAIVDDEDFERLSKNKWYFCFGYATRAFWLKEKKKQIKILMHREVLNNSDKREVDHINHNKIDNRKQNLRFCSHRQNLINVPISKRNTSGYKGVIWEGRKNKWVVYVRHHGKDKFGGYFIDKKTAAKSYNKLALKYFGEFACINNI
jgi:hypothetical protein